MRRSLFTVATAAVASTAAIGVSLSTGTVASAATAPPRLAGTFSTASTVVATNNGEAVGTKYTRPYTFQPACSTGACATQVKRTRGDGSSVSYTIKPISSTTYRGATSYLGSCQLRSNGSFVAKAYTYTETLAVTIDRSVNGQATAFRGTLVLKFTPTAIGNQYRCGGGSETVRLVGRHV